MTTQKSFKTLVRLRMDKTGESCTAAQAMLRAAAEKPPTVRPAPATSEEAIRERTGRGWEEWFDLLDERGAAERPHREIARRVATQPTSARFDRGDGEAERMQAYWRDRLTVPKSWLEGGEVDA